MSLREALRHNDTRTVRGLRSALSSESTSVMELLKIDAIHQRYLALGGAHGRFGYPTSSVEFSGDSAIREFRGGTIKILGGGVVALPQHKVSVRFVGFKCLEESDWDQASPHDEPYFVVTVDQGNGMPFVKKFGEFEGIDSGDEMTFAEELIKDVPPNPTAIRVLAYENDYGDPDKTAKNIQDKIVELSKAAGAAASAAGDAADGPGMGVSAAAGTVGGIAAGPIGALIAAGIVAGLGLGDDFINQAATLLFDRADNVGTPPNLGQFGGMDYNRKIYINGGAQGEYDLFFNVIVTKDDPDLPV